MVVRRHTCSIHVDTNRWRDGATRIIFFRGCFSDFVEKFAKRWTSKLINHGDISLSLSPLLWCASLVRRCRSGGDDFWREQARTMKKFVRFVHRNIVSISRTRLNKITLLLMFPVPPCCIAAGCSPERKKNRPCPCTLSARKKEGKFFIEF